jgi:CheY-like chemotaxis protein
MPHALIVDDGADVVGWMSEVVQAEGYTVAKADSLRNARAQLVRQTPDVLLTDLQLPDGRGTDLVRDLESPQQTEVNRHHRPRQRRQRDRGRAHRRRVTWSNRSTWIACVRSCRRRPPG